MSSPWRLSRCFSADTYLVVCEWASVICYDCVCCVFLGAWLRMNLEMRSYDWPSRHWCRPRPLPPSLPTLLWEWRIWLVHPQAFVSSFQSLSTNTHKPIDNQCLSVYLETLQSFQQHIINKTTQSMINDPRYKGERGKYSLIFTQYLFIFFKYRINMKKCNNNAYYCIWHILFIQQWCRNNNQRCDKWLFL